MTRVRRIADLIDPEASKPKRRVSARRPRDAKGRPVSARRGERPTTGGAMAILTRLGVALGGVSLLAVVWMQPVRSVEIRGVELSPAGTISAILQGEVGQRWVTAPVDQLQTALLCDPWIDSVEVTRAPGGRLVVDVIEAEPVLRLVEKNRVWALDVRGRLLPIDDHVDISSLPRLRGVRADGGTLLEEDRALVSDVVDALIRTPWAWAGGLEELALYEGRPCELMTGNGVALVFDAPEAQTQLRNAATAWAQVAPSPGQRLDLRFVRQIIVTDAKPDRSARGG